MAQEADSLQYNAERGIVANSGGLEFLKKLDALNDRVTYLESEHTVLKSEHSTLESEHTVLKSGHSTLESEHSKLKSAYSTLESNSRGWEMHRQVSMDLRQRAITTWVRDTLHRDTPRRKDHIRALNKGIHGGNVRVDFMVVSERFKAGSTEWRHFSTLYGLTPDDMRALDQARCPESLRALDRLASILFDEHLLSFPNEELNDQREKLVALLREGNYEDAEEMSPTICGDE